MKRLIQLEGLGRVIGHIFILIVIFLVGRLIYLEVENRILVNEKKYEQLQSAIYENTGVIIIDYSPADIAWDGYYLWVSEGQDNFIQKIDPWEGRVVAELEVGDGPFSLAWDGVNLWVANIRDSTVQQLDVQAMEVVRTIAVGKGPDSLIWDGTSLWVSCSNSGIIQQIDISSGELITELDLELYPLLTILVGNSLLIAGEVWYWDSEGTEFHYGDIWRIDIHSGEMSKELKIELIPRTMLWDGDSLWITNERILQKIDIHSGEVIAEMDISGFAGEMLWDGSHLWVVNMRNNSLLKIDSKQALVIDSIPVEREIEVIAWDSSNLWVAQKGFLRKVTPYEYWVNGNIAAMVWDGSGLWVVNGHGPCCDYGSVQYFDTVTGKLGPEILIHDDPAEAAWDGDSILVADWRESVIQRIDPQAGGVVAEINIDNSPPEIWDGKYLWAVNSKDGFVSQVNVSREIVARIYPGRGLKGNIWDGEYLWTIGSGRLLHQIDPKTNTIFNTFMLEYEASDLIWAADSLWVDAFQRIDPQTGDVLAEVDVYCGTDQSAWDGKYLWASCEDSLFQLDPLSGKVLSTIHLDDPAALVWDGVNLWVANKNNIQKIDVQSLESIRELWREE